MRGDDLFMNFMFANCCQKTVNPLVKILDLPLEERRQIKETISQTRKRAKYMSIKETWKPLDAKGPQSNKGKKLASWPWKLIEWLISG